MELTLTGRRDAKRTAGPTLPNGDTVVWCGYEAGMGVTRLRVTQRNVTTEV